MTRPWTDEDLLRELFVGEKLTHHEIADELGCSRTSVSRHIRKFGIKQPHQKKEVLQQLYYEELLSITEIADRLETTYAKVQRAMSNFGIEKRDKTAATAVGRHSKDTVRVLLDADELRRLYRDEQLTQKEIADRIGCSEHTVIEWMKRHGIAARTQTEAQYLAKSNPKAAEILLDAEALRSLYYEEGLRLREIADHLDSSAAAVCRALGENGIEPRPRPRGKNHHNWKGGYRRYYGPNWLKQRETRLERDGYQCVVCKISNEEHNARYDKGLAVHHIRPFRTFREDGMVDYDAANRLENLVTLCVSCHRRWEGIPLRPQTD